MKFSAGDIEDILTTIGQEADVDGSAIFVVYHAPGQVADGLGNLVVENPQAVASAADVEALHIAGGANGSTIWIGGDPFKVLAIVPDGAGFSTLTLEAVT